MKRILSIALAAALVLQATAIFAQEAGEPSEQSVLDAARAKYWGSKKSSDSRAAQLVAPEATEEEAPEAEEAPAIAAENEAAAAEADEEAAEPREAKGGREYRYSPFIVAFVPGLNFPFGLRDASLTAGLIGARVHDVSGIEAASVMTIADDVRGVQGAGVFNIASSVSGAQGAGVFNIVDGELRGVQGAGVFNIAGSAQLSAQGAGVFNISHDMLGVQGAGLFNIADDLRGVQGAGLFNIADDVRGVQAAGLFNRAEKVEGLQIGVVNVAKEVKGLQLGLINIAGNGSDALGVIYEPATDYLYAYWQAGLPSLYATIGAGAKCRDWNFEYSGAVVSVGLGSSTRFLGLKLNMDLSAEQVLEDLPYDSYATASYRHYYYNDRRGSIGWAAWDGWSQLSPYPSLKISLGLPIGRHWQLVGGIKADIQIDELGAWVPESLKGGWSWSGDFGGSGFTVWPKWFIGLKI